MGQVFGCELDFARPDPPDWDEVARGLSLLYPRHCADPVIRVQPEATRIRLAGTGLSVTRLAPRNGAALRIGIAARAPAALSALRSLTLLAGVLAHRRDCTGLRWGARASAHPPAALRAAAAMVEAGTAPAGFWFGGQEGPTRGLSALIGHEVSIDIPEGAGEIHGLSRADLLGSVFAWLITHGVPDAPLTRLGIGGAALSLTREPGLLRLSLPRRAPADPPETGAAPAREEEAKAETGLPPAAMPGPDPAPRPPGPQIPAEPPRPATATATLPDLPAAGPDGRAATRHEALLLYEAGRAPDLIATAETVRRALRRLGVTPAIDPIAPGGRGAAAGAGLDIDWGPLRGIGHRRSRILLNAAPPDARMRRFIAETSPQPGVSDALLGMSALVSVCDVTDRPGTDPAHGAVLVSQVSAALMTLRGAQGLVWCASGVMLLRDAADSALAQAENGLPLGLCVARLTRARDGTAPVRVTRGFAALGERELVLLEADEDIADSAFASLVQAMYRRELQRQGDAFLNTRDGALYRLSEDRPPGLGPVLLARMITRPQQRAGMFPRLLGRKGD